MRRITLFVAALMLAGVAGEANARPKRTGGGWDANGPSVSGSVAPTPAEPRRGGWDGNGAAISGADRPNGASELNLDGLRVDAVVPPKPAELPR